MPNKKTPFGAIISADITVPNANELRDFYQQVIGWESEEMVLSDRDGKYADYVMKDKEGNWVGGICHARGQNVGIPPQWIIYVNVEDIEQSVKKCVELGGKVIKELRNENVLVYAMIEDPIGAVMALTKAE